MEFSLKESEDAANILKVVFIIVILVTCLFFGFYPLFW